MTDPTPATGADQGATCRCRKINGHFYEQYACPVHGQPANQGGALTEAEREARMQAVSDEAICVAEDVWTEDEPTLAEYELTQRILDAAQLADERERIAREGGQ